MRNCRENSSGNSMLAKEILDLTRKSVLLFCACSNRIFSVFLPAQYPLPIYFMRCNQVKMCFYKFSIPSSAFMTGVFIWIKSISLWKLFSLNFGLGIEAIFLFCRATQAQKDQSGQAVKRFVPFWFMLTLICHFIIRDLSFLQLANSHPCYVAFLKRLRYWIKILPFYSYLLMSSMHL